MASPSALANPNPNPNQAASPAALANLANPNPNPNPNQAASPSALANLAASMGLAVDDDDIGDSEVTFLQLQPRP